MEEIWKDVDGFEGLYKVSNMGNVKTVEHDIVYSNGSVHRMTEHMMKPKGDSYGYHIVCLTKNNRKHYLKVHRLVAKAFIDNPDDLPCVNHKNEIKNDNRVENLEWCTVRYNNIYGTRLQRISDATSKSKHWNSRRVCQVDKDTDEVIKVWDCVRDVERELGYYHTNISACCLGSRNHKTAYGFKWRYMK